jgi:hypothetical protein
MRAPHVSNGADTRSTPPRLRVSRDASAHGETSAMGGRQAVAATLLGIILGGPVDPNLP